MYVDVVNEKFYKSDHHIDRKCQHKSRVPEYYVQNQVIFETWK